MITRPPQVFKYVHSWKNSVCIHVVLKIKDLISSQNGKLSTAAKDQERTVESFKTILYMGPWFGGDKFVRVYDKNKQNQYHFTTYHWLLIFIAMIPKGSL